MNFFSSSDKNMFVRENLCVSGWQHIRDEIFETDMCYRATDPMDFGRADEVRSHVNLEKSYLLIRN